jgi:hypothetical protein
MSQLLSLKSLLVPSKEVDSEYPGMPGFIVSLSFLSRETLQAIRKKATKTTFKKHTPVEALDDDLFLELYVKAAIRGWKGLTLAYLQNLAPVDLGENDLSQELAYSEENALYLMKNSGQFDSFVSDVVSDLGNFSKNSSI